MLRNHEVEQLAFEAFQRDPTLDRNDAYQRLIVQSWAKARGGMELGAWEAWQRGCDRAVKKGRDAMIKRWNEEKMTGVERPRTFYSYHATGSGGFPMDMLRYDSCWPATSEDTNKMDPFGSRERRSVKLHSYTEPTPGRWNSFGWSLGAEDPDKDR